MTDSERAKASAILMLNSVTPAERAAAFEELWEALTELQQTEKRADLMDKRLDEVSDILSGIGRSPF